MFTFMLFMLAIIYFVISDLFKAIKRGFTKLKQVKYAADLRKYKRQRTEYEDRLKEYARQTAEYSGCVTPASFIEMKHDGRIPKFKGCYIFHNLTKDIYYVGQSINVAQRVANHIQGRGNADVYFDLRSGDDFRVSIINIKNTNYSTLNSLEKYLISLYDANTHGYNKTAGNRG